LLRSIRSPKSSRSLLAVLMPSLILIGASIGLAASMLESIRRKARFSSTVVLFLPLYILSFGIVTMPTMRRQFYRKVTNIGGSDRSVELFLGVGWKGSRDLLANFPMVGGVLWIRIRYRSSLMAFGEMESLRGSELSPRIETISRGKRNEARGETN
jgi:hypothetical protein